MTSSEPVVVATFANEVAAEIAQGILEASGIASFIPGDGAAYGPAFRFGSGVRLMVREDQLAAAKELLAEAE